jgi:hypothetical protein
MLIEQAKNKYQVDEIVSFKLLSGDEVLGKLVSSGEGCYELDKPCLVVTTPEGIGLIQAMFGLDPDLETLTVRDQHIVMMCRTHEKMRDHYITVVSNKG